MIILDNLIKKLYYQIHYHDGIPPVIIRHIEIATTDSPEGWCLRRSLTLVKYKEVTKEDYDYVKVYEPIKKVSYKLDETVDIPNNVKHQRILARQVNAYDRKLTVSETTDTFFIQLTAAETRGLINMEVLYAQFQIYHFLLMRSELKNTDNCIYIP